MKKSLKKQLICIYFILLCCVFFSTSLSRNVTKVTGTASMEVAEMQLNVVTQEVTLANVSNQEKEIEFTVNNYSGTTEDPIYNDTEYEYQISITTSKNIPLEYELYKVEEDNSQTKITLTNGTSESFTMPHSKIQEDTYVLKVKLDNKEYKNLEDAININVYAVQQS